MDFPGGTVGKNLPANAGDMSSVSSLGGFHTLWSNKAQAPQLLSLCSGTHGATRESLRAATKTQHIQKLINKIIKKNKHGVTMAQAFK